MCIPGNRNHYTCSGVNEISCVLLEILKIEQEAPIGADKEFVFLIADEVSYITVDRQHPTCIGFVIVIFKIPHAQTDCKPITKPPSVNGCNANVVMRIWCGNDLQSETISSFSHIVVTSRKKRYRSCGSGIEFMTSPKVLLMFQELNLVKVETAFSDYLCSGIRCSQCQNNKDGVKSFHFGAFLRVNDLGV